MTYIGGVRLRTAMLAGALAGIGAGFVFAAAHAIIIVPIWDRMMMGLAFGAAAGAVGGWTFAELYPDAETKLGGQNFRNPHGTSVRPAGFFYNLNRVGV